MIQSELDETLHDSAPKVYLPTDLSLHTANILADTQSRYRRRRTAWIGGAVAVLLVAGGGSAAIAATGIAPWAPDAVVQAPSAAHPQCDEGFQITAENGTLSNAPAVKAARAILKTINLKVVDTTAMQAYILQQDATATDGTTGQPSPIHLGSDDLKQQALQYTVNGIIQTRLTAQGYDSTQVGLSATIAGCGK
jgi:hypothetical protein